MTFGYFDDDAYDGDMTRIYNYGRNDWRVPMKEFIYGSEEVKSVVSTAKMAFIDSSIINI